MGIKPYGESSGLSPLPPCRQSSLNGRGEDEKSSEHLGHALYAFGELIDLLLGIVQGKGGADGAQDT